MADERRSVNSIGTREVMEMVIERGMPSCKNFTFDVTEKPGITISGPAFRGARAWLFFTFPEEFVL